MSFGQESGIAFYLVLKLVGGNFVHMLNALHFVVVAPNHIFHKQLRNELFFSLLINVLLWSIFCRDILALTLYCIIFVPMEY